MGASHEQATLMLKLYDLRREAKLREAREWYVGSFHPSSMEDMMKNYAPNTEGGTFLRMVVSYWEMVANLANRGLVDEELLFETTGEQWIVWERMKPLIAAWRAGFKNPHAFGQLEEHVKRYEAWREKRAPGSNEVMRQMFAKMRAEKSAQTEAASATTH